ncbi:MAG: RHS repeat-associated core domain-containing protein [Gammaproteobacteria bacterium]
MIQGQVSISYSKKLPGQYYDQETGLHYNYFRYYDSSIGRYITSDPIGLEAGTNTYIYALNNPLYWIDKYGLTASCPTTTPWNSPNWRPYVDSFFRYLGAVYFHCGFYGFLEVRENECDKSPIGECFYDENGILVDGNHRYAGCGGTPNEYDDLRHIYPDRGGVARSGPRGYATSVSRAIGF